MFVHALLYLCVVCGAVCGHVFNGGRKEGGLCEDCEEPAVQSQPQGRCVAWMEKQCAPFRLAHSGSSHITCAVFPRPQRALADTRPTETILCSCIPMSISTERCLCLRNLVTLCNYSKKSIHILFQCFLQGVEV